MQRLETVPLIEATPETLKSLYAKRKQMADCIKLIEDKRWLYYRHPSLIVASLLGLGAFVASIYGLMESLPERAHAFDSAQAQYDNSTVPHTNTNATCGEVFPISSVCTADANAPQDTMEEECQKFGLQLCEDIPAAKMMCSVFGMPISLWAIAVIFVFAKRDEKLSNDPEHIPSKVKNFFSEEGEPLYGRVTKEEVVKLLNQNIDKLTQQILAIEAQGVHLENSAHTSWGLFSSGLNAVRNKIWGVAPDIRATPDGGPRVKYGSL